MQTASKCIRIIVEDKIFDSIRMFSMPAWVERTIELEGRDCTVARIETEQCLSPVHFTIIRGENRNVHLAELPVSTPFIDIVRTTRGLIIHGEYEYLVYLAKRYAMNHPRMSYNDSYFGENPGELKRLANEMDSKVQQLEATKRKVEPNSKGYYDGCQTIDQKIDMEMHVGVSRIKPPPFPPGPAMRRSCDCIHADPTGVTCCKDKKHGH